MLSVLAMLATLLLLPQVRIASRRYSTKFFVTLFVLIISFFLINLTFQISFEGTERQSLANVNFSFTRFFFFFYVMLPIVYVHRYRARIINIFFQIEKQTINTTEYFEIILHL